MELATFLDAFKRKEHIKLFFFLKQGLSPPNKEKDDLRKSF